MIYDYDYYDYYDYHDYYYYGDDDDYLKGFAPMPPAPLVWKYGYEVAKWRVVSENCGCQVAKWRCVSETGGSRRRPEARPGGSGGSKIARRLGGPKSAVRVKEKTS